MTNEEFWQHYTVLRDEVTEATHSYYAYKTINDFAAEDERHLRQINEVSDFWIITQRALYSTFMVTIGRIFDRDKRSFSIHRLLDQVVAYPDRFSKSALAERKRRQPGFQKEWIDEYVKEAWVPSAAELHRFRDALAPSRAKYDEIYKHLRHKAIAHSDMDRDAIKALIDRSRYDDVEDILSVLNDLLNCLHDLWYNGRCLEPGVRIRDYGSRIETTTRQALIQFMRT